MRSSLGDISESTAFHFKYKQECNCRYEMVTNITESAAFLASVSIGFLIPSERLKIVRDLLLCFLRL